MLASFILRRSFRKFYRLRLTYKRYNLTTNSLFSYTPNAIIIGGGPGGCIAALSLKKCGINSIIYESSDISKYNDELSGVILLHGGSVCLKWLGLEEEWLLKYNKADKLHYSDNKSKQLFTIDMSKMKYSYLFGFIARHRFNTMLRNKCLQTDGITFYDKKKFIKYTQNDDTITAHFDDNTSVEAQIILGIDGINSTVRKQMVVSDSYKKSSGVCAWLATGNLSELDAMNNKIVTDYTQFQLTKNAFAMFSPSLNANEYTLLLFHNEISNKNDYIKITRNLDINENKENILKWLNDNEFDSRFKHSINYVKNIIPLDINVVKMKNRKSWNDNRCIILGDAAHATTPFGGQGCNNAIYDAVALTHIINKYKEKHTMDDVKELLANKTIVNEIFQELFKVRAGYSNSAVNDSLALSVLMAVPTRFYKIRDLFARFLGKIGIVKIKAGKIMKPRVGFDIIKEIEKQNL